MLQMGLKIEAFFFVYQISDQTAVRLFAVPNKWEV